MLSALIRGTGKTYTQTEEILFGLAGYMTSVAPLRPWWYPTGLNSGLFQELKTGLHEVGMYFKKLNDTSVDATIGMQAVINFIVSPSEVNQAALKEVVSNEWYERLVELLQKCIEFAFVQSNVKEIENVIYQKLQEELLENTKLSFDKDQDYMSAKANFEKWAKLNAANKKSMLSQQIDPYLQGFQSKLNDISLANDSEENLADILNAMMQFMREPSESNYTNLMGCIADLEVEESSDNESQALLAKSDDETEAEDSLSNNDDNDINKIPENIKLHLQDYCKEIAKDIYVDLKNKATEETRISHYQSLFYKKPEEAKLLVVKISAPAKQQDQKTEQKKLNERPKDEQKQIEPVKTYTLSLEMRQLFLVEIIKYIAARANDLEGKKLNFISRWFRNSKLTTEKLKLACELKNKIEGEAKDYDDVKKIITSYKDSNTQKEKQFKKKYYFWMKSDFVRCLDKTQAAMDNEIKKLKL